MEDQLNGSLDDTTRDFVLGSCLIAGAKPGGGVRPIAMGEPVYKLAGQYALYLVRPELAPLVEPIQLSLSPGGSERAVHVLQAAMETGGPDSIVVKTDFETLSTPSSVLLSWRKCSRLPASPVSGVLYTGPTRRHQPFCSWTREQS